MSMIECIKPYRFSTLGTQP